MNQRVGWGGVLLPVDGDWGAQSESEPETRMMTRTEVEMRAMSAKMIATSFHDSSGLVG